MSGDTKDSSKMPDGKWSITTICYGFTLFLAAFLLFQVQPIMGKYMLPWFGGSPNVWIVCLLFFQLWLVLGYAYAHVVSCFFKPRIQVVIHTILIGLTAVSLPLAPTKFWHGEIQSMPTWQILSILAASLGVAYLLIASTSSLLQRWITRVDHPAKAPYRFYAISNAGSLLGLLSYPILFEPLMSRHQHCLVWTGATIGLLVLLFLCQIPVWRSRHQQVQEEELESEAENVDAQRPASDKSWFWFCLAACANALLMTVTSRISLDIAAVPFIWILPLSVFLITFIICFYGYPRYSRQWCGGGYFVSITAVCVVFYMRKHFGFDSQLVIYLSTLFFGCMICNGELIRSKPPVEKLTWFYLVIGVGGVTGSLLVILLSPLLFSDLYEFQLAMMAVGLLLFIAAYRDQHSRLYRGKNSRQWAYLVSAWLIVGMAFFMEIVHSRQNTLVMYRNFFGTLKAYERSKNKPDRHRCTLQHGNIVHGLQMMGKELRSRRTTYYSETGGGGLAMAAIADVPDRKIGVVGLGTGTMASYGKPTDLIRFYEINPAVVKAAREQFTFLRDSKAQIEINKGDARLLMEKEPPQNYDLLIIDAFSSDAIPPHLLTLEAFKLYLRHLKPKGILALHLSNRHLDLRPVVREAAEKLDTKWVVIEDYSKIRKVYGTLPSLWMLVSTNDDRFKQPPIKEAATISPHFPRVRAWTDDYTSLLPLLK